MTRAHCAPPRYPVALEPAPGPIQGLRMKFPGRLVQAIVLLRTRSAATFVCDGLSTTSEVTPRQGTRPARICRPAALSRQLGLVTLCIFIAITSMPAAAVADADRIQPYQGNPSYWQYKGRPVLLLGGSDQDNLFNHPNLGPAGLEAHLDLLAAVGGNYVRNTMSSRDRADDRSDRYNDDNLYAFHRDEATGLYDLDRFNQAFWTRFRDFLEMTARRDIIVQIEIWDRWDYGPDREPHYKAFGWSAHPFNPRNNVNYTSAETGLPEENWQGYPIFRTIPELDNRPRVLTYQEAFVEKLLSISFAYGHVLYCISNESTASEEWSRHWATFVRDRARQADVNIQVTEMWDNWDLTHAMHRRTFDHPALYSFVDISQNNHQRGQTHWDNMQAARRLVADPPRPMNNVKIYGGEHHGGGLMEGAHKLWRSALGGCASARFHRPGRLPGYYGAGLNELAQTQIRSLRMLTDAMDVFACEPRNDLLDDRADNEAYCLAEPGKHYAVYFPDGGTVKLDVSAASGSLQIRWLDIASSAWQKTHAAAGGGMLELETPGQGQWAVLVQLMK
jgi:hypothetical protein